jgi:hypothetical protein
MNNLTEINNLLAMQKWTSDTMLLDLVIGIIPGVIIFILGYSWKKLWDLKNNYLYKAFFGKETTKLGLTIALATYNDTRLLSNGEQLSLGINPPQSVGRGGPRFYKNFPTHKTVFQGGIGDLLSYTSSKGATYIVESIAKVSKQEIDIVSDYLIAADREGTYVSIGSSGTNIKTDQIKKSSGNMFLKDDLGSKLILKDGRSVELNNQSDIGYILKIDNPYFNGNTLIACAGLAETGSSGSAWYLARYWKKLYSRFGKNPFLVILSFEHGSDNSAKELFYCGIEKRTYRIKKRIFN